MAHDVTKLIEVVEAMGPTPLPPEISSYEDGQDPEVKGAWTIQNQTSADWALARVAECEAEAAEVVAQYEAAVRRLARRRDELIARALRGKGYFTFKLSEWAERNRASLLKGKSKSVQMLHGSVGWRKGGGRLKVADKDALSAWLSSQPVESGLYRVRVEAEMRALQAWCAESGEVPPGCDFVPEHDEFYVRPESPETALETTR